MSVLKLVSLLFPFVRDMLLGESSISYALKTNKLRVLLLALLMFCLAWTLYSVPRLVELATEQVRLEHRYEALEAKRIQPPTPKGTTPPLLASQAEGPVLSSQPSPSSPPIPAPPTEATIPSPSPDFKARQQSWLTSLNDGRSRQ